MPIDLRVALVKRMESTTSTLAGKSAVRDSDGLAHGMVSVEAASAPAAASAYFVEPIASSCRSARAGNQFIAALDSD